jgi:hypothetical protein
MAQFNRMILSNPESAVAQYNRVGLHYNLVAEGIYRARVGIDPFSGEYERFIIAGLIAFDIERMMGQGDKYATDGPGFRGRLKVKMRAIREAVGDLSVSCLNKIDLAANTSRIEAAYNCLAAAGDGALNADSADQFHVGATKILHWIIPSLFIMVDTNVAVAFRKHHQVNYRKGTQPGYTARKYVDCLQHAQDEIRAYGVEKFFRIELGTPLARLFDKVAWVAGLSV